jgi:hypothetical protein
VARNWEATRKDVREWYALVERCKVTMRDACSQDALVTSTELVTILLEKHPELTDLREARNALDYALEKRGRKRLFWGTHQVPVRVHII